MTVDDRLCEDTSLSHIIRIMWKNKSIIIALTIVASLVAYIGSQFLTPKYQASVTMKLGNTGDLYYTDLNYAKMLLLHENTIEQIKEELNISLLSANENIRITNIPNTNFFKIETIYEDEELAVAILDILSKIYIDGSQLSYNDKKESVLQTLAKHKDNLEKALNNYKRYEQKIDSIEQNQDLTVIEIDIYIFGLTDYLRIVDNKIIDLTNIINNLEVELDSMEQVSVFSGPIFENKIYPQTILYVMLGAILGLGAGVFLVLVTDYFRKHPIKL